MEKIKIRRKISSSTLRIRELEKLINRNVDIVITPIEKKKENLDNLLTISQWDISENDVKMKSWKLENY